MELPNGIPSHDAFGRVLPAEFQRSFQRWIQAIRTVTAGEVVAIDGKTLRWSYDRSSEQAAIHLVNAWAQQNPLVRGYWGIENSVHWSLDVSFREDDCRIRTGSAPEHFAVLRHIALNVLKHDTRTKRGIKPKRLKAGWDNDYLASLLFSGVRCDCPGCYHKRAFIF